MLPGNGAGKLSLFTMLPGNGAGDFSTHVRVRVRVRVGNVVRFRRCSSLFDFCIRVRVPMGFPYRSSHPHNLNGIHLLSSKVLAG
jgi:hypothetical protein